MSTFSELWPKFKRSKRYREQFVAQHAKQAIPFQIRELLKRSKLTQKDFAKRAGMTQGAVSRAADPSYGNLTINTLVRIAAGFDVAFVGRFVPFSELPKWFDRLHSEPFTVATFHQEDAELTAQNLSATTTAVPTVTALDSLPSNVVLLFRRKGPKRSEPRSQPRNQTKPSGFQPSPLEGTN